MSASGGEGILLWKILSAGFGVLAVLLGYLIKKRDEKIDENTDHVTDLKEKVIVMQTRHDIMYQDVGEMKENLMGIMGTMQDIKVSIATLPCDRDCQSNKTRYHKKN